MLTGDLLTVEEVARRLRLHLDTARRFVREGRITATKVGRRYLVPEKALLRFIESGFPAALIEEPPGSAPIQTLPLSRIRLDFGIEPREGYNSQLLQTYKAAMECGAQFPPIEVFLVEAD